MAWLALALPMAVLVVLAVYANVDAIRTRDIKKAKKATLLYLVGAVPIVANLFAILSSAPNLSTFNAWKEPLFVVGAAYVCAQFVVLPIFLVAYFRLRKEDYSSW